MPLHPLHFTLSLALLAALPACTLGPDPARPDLSAQLPAHFKVPEGWKIAQPADADPKGAWWTMFRDSRLNSLMDQSMAANQSLRSAFLRVEQARSVADITRAPLFPEFSFDPSANRERRSGTTRRNVGSSGGTTTTNIRLPFVLGYEVDLWGKLRRELQAAQADADASAADYQNVILALQADLAANYFSLRAIDREIEILGKALDLRQKSLDLNQKRFKAGDLDEVDVSRAETEVSATESEILGLRKTRAALENAIAVLAGTPSSNFSLAPSPLTSPPPPSAASLPSDLLERRPDIARAERTMQAENARIGAAQAAFFPSVRIGGTAGLESAGLDQLFRADSRTWGFGPELSLPIFQGGRNQAELERSRLRYEESVAQYRQTVLDAVRDVDDALAAANLLAQQSEAQDRTVVSALRTVELSQKRFDGGLVAFFDVVDAQRTALDAARSSVRILGARHLAAIALVKAVGGKWN